MEETRTRKYKAYRKSIYKGDNPSDFSSSDVIEGGQNNSLSFDDVIETNKEPKKFDLCLFFRKYAKVFEIIVIVIGLLLIILGIILWAKNVWRA